MSTSSIFHVIKDPVHGTMEFTAQEDRWIKPFINHALFQRLRHIKQLGLGDLIFPGAVHTRFNHSLGCCYVASQISNQLELNPDEKQLVVVACLLHDMGHGPFSHAFEDIFRDKAVRHEDWTPYFLSEYHQDEFIDAYNILNKQHPLSKEKLLRLQAMIMHEEQDDKLMADIVSSQLDADRLDYLLRDSHFCGVNYGEFDFKWMLHVMTRVKKDGCERLGVTHKGIGVVEHYLLARRLMMRNIYHHQKKFAIEAWLVKLFQYLAVEIENDVHVKILQHTSLGKFIINVNRFNQSKQGKATFLSENYALYKNLYDYDVFMVIRQLASMSGSQAIFKLARRLHGRKIPKIYSLSQKQCEIAKSELPLIRKQYGKDVCDWQVMLIEAPHRSYTVTDDPILIDDGGVIRSLSEMSPIVDALSDELEYAGCIALDRELVGSPIEKGLFDALMAKNN